MLAAWHSLNSPLLHESAGVKRLQKRYHIAGICFSGKKGDQYLKTSGVVLSSEFESQLANNVGFQYLSVPYLGKSFGAPNCR